MCGIVGYIGPQDPVEVLIEGLRRLEYRGYDSAGIAVIDSEGGLELRRAPGKLRDLETVLQQAPIRGKYGIGHTRWATHGRPTEENAHPHRDCSERLVVIHNGIIENYVDLKHELEDQGHTFVTQTDTEVVAHALEQAIKDGASGLVEALRLVLPRLEGIYALVAVSADEPDLMVAARQGPPLVVGLGEGETFIASDIPAILSHTKDVVFMDDGEIVVVDADGPSFIDLAGNAIEKEAIRVPWDPIMAEKDGYKHFMLKEIHEQARAVRDTLLGRVSLESSSVLLEDEIGLSDDQLRDVKRMAIVACGTSWHAGQVGKFLIERLAGVPVEVDYASEFRYRQPLIDASVLPIFISQSGETADTLAALREAKSKGAETVGICNVQGSMLTREATGTVYTHAGPEIGVASTKAFTSQLVAITLLALHIGRVRGKIEDAEMKQIVEQLYHVPAQMERYLADDGPIQELARRFQHHNDFLYLGRGVNYPIALEGALKLKEISYIHAEGYPAGEMKHGPIALIDEELPVVALAPRDSVYEKMLSNIEEVKARSGIVIAVTDQEDAALRDKADAVIVMPRTHELLSPLLMVLPLQLLAYHIALLRGCDVDQPRNLAKSVTVE
ncbi:MAG: glutamine--fructose-6-phosphate transaminase (isomerizing) [Acidobacteriota bacterium]|nr:glutamine--fructose-6-phosphate transaminase (isomerizing) [Acidobacteriota bacterium]MDH3784268.1 glutamine--fructose-6-phosphate transaminase (isomerizing) [Acidobacteriota bacterium]